jgi:hypothetical protein
MISLNKACNLLDWTFLVTLYNIIGYTSKEEPAGFLFNLGAMDIEEV